MAETLEFYVDTSVWNYIYASHLSDNHKATMKFFKSVKSGQIRIAVSQVVLDEIAAAPVDMRNKLSKSIKEFDPELLKFTQEVDEMSARYIHEGAFSPNKRNDALHVAFATIYEMDALVTWNCKDMANLQRRRIIEGINIKWSHLKRLEIITPLEVSHETM